MTAPQNVDRLDLEACPPGSVSRFRVWLVADGLGDRIRLPVIVVRGVRPGPVLGITAALHGNELNGVGVVHELVRGLDPAELTGAVLALPVVNVPGYHLHRREFLDGVDLNRVFPGREGGTPSALFAARLMDRIVLRMTHLIDLHTASFGRVNSLYVRADMNDPLTATLARVFGPEIIVHNFGTDGTLRSAASSAGIPSITVEIGDPQRFQERRVRSTIQGLRGVMAHLGMLPLPEQTGDNGAAEPVVCARSYWLRTRTGGVLDVLPTLLDRLEAGQTVAVVRDTFGDLLETYTAPEGGVVVGRSTNPVAPTGSRILHLGVPGDPAEVRTPSPREE